MFIYTQELHCCLRKVSMFQQFRANSRPKICSWKKHKSASTYSLNLVESEEVDTGCGCGRVHVHGHAVHRLLLCGAGGGWHAPQASVQDEALAQGREFFGGCAPCVAHVQQQGQPRGGARHSLLHDRNLFKIHSHISSF